MPETTLSERERLASEQLELAARMREQFMSIISHELRSPLNGIQSWAHVLESQVDTNQPLIKRALVGIRTGVDQQVKLIDDLLDANNVLSGKTQIEPQRIDVVCLVQAAIEQVAPVATEKKMRIALTGEPSATVDADPLRIRQVLVNLMTNAITASADEAIVTVTVSQQGADVCVSVQDAGKGIAAELLPNIFEPFRPQQGSRARRSGGVGLGLAVSRHLVELHGGRLTAASQGEGHGSTFSLCLARAKD